MVAPMRGALLVASVLLSCAPEHSVLGRPYELHEPGLAREALPLVILAHGYGVNGVGQDLIFPFSKQVEARRFLYALPNGTQDALGKRFWNATDACCNNDGVPVDDVAFFRALIDDVKQEHAVGRVYVVGHSNGGFMALRLACDAPDLVDGVVAVSASTFNEPLRCPDGRAVPVLLVHGTEDTWVPIEGRPGRYPGAVETAERFARRGGCTGPWESLERADFLGPADAESRRERLTGCPAGMASELWSIEGGGHLLVFDERWTGATLDWLLEHAP